eukprot:1221305-Prymnesium_polylepis.1
MTRRPGAVELWQGTDAVEVRDVATRQPSICGRTGARSPLAAPGARASSSWRQERGFAPSFDRRGA